MELQRSIREDPERPEQRTDGSVVPVRLGNASGGKGPCSDAKVERNDSPRRLTIVFARRGDSRSGAASGPADSRARGGHGA